MLVVEDNPDSQFLLEALLCDLCTVDLASDADEALGLAETHDYQAVLLDINLGPGRSGVDVLHELRHMDRFAKTPVTALTAYAMPGDRERFLGEGFTHYLAKPFTPEALLALVEKMIED